MLTAIVMFKDSDPITHDDAGKRFRISALKYADVPGLIRKYFCIAADGKSGAGIYLWESKEAAEALFTEEWMDKQVGNFGVRPTITWLDCITVVDNLHHDIIHA